MSEWSIDGTTDGWRRIKHTAAPRFVETFGAATEPLDVEEIDPITWNERNPWLLCAVEIIDARSVSAASQQADKAAQISTPAKINAATPMNIPIRSTRT